MMACRRPTPPSSPLWGVRSISGKMLLTASSRPISDSAFPARSKVVLSLSTTTLPGAATADAAANDGAAAGVAETACRSGAAGATACATGAGALRLVPQLLQNNSPAGLLAPQLGHGTLALPAGVAGMLAPMDGTGATNRSPHSSQKSEPSSFSCPFGHRTDIAYPPLRDVSPTCPPAAG